MMEFHTSTGIHAIPYYAQIVLILGGNHHKMAIFFFTCARHSPRKEEIWIANLSRLPAVQSRSLLPTLLAHRLHVELDSHGGCYIDYKRIVSRLSLFFIYRTEQISCGELLATLTIRNSKFRPLSVALDF